MVHLQLPPPRKAVAPCFREIPAGEKLVRLFDPSRYGATALTFRKNGPRKRFDHHRGRGPKRTPCDDPARAVSYAAWSEDLDEAFSSCLVAVFGDTGLVETGEFRVAMPAVARPLHLLDLCGHGAMRAGTVAAIAKCEHRLSQPWSRYFDESTADFDGIDGFLYRNAHNDEPAVMLYERAEAGLVCPRTDVVRLDHAGLRPLLLRAMRRNNLSF